MCGRLAVELKIKILFASSFLSPPCVARTLLSRGTQHFPWVPVKQPSYCGVPTERQAATRSSNTSLTGLPSSRRQPVPMGPMTRGTRMRRCAGPPPRRRRHQCVLRPRPPAFSASAPRARTIDRTRTRRKFTRFHPTFPFGSAVNPAYHLLIMLLAFAIRINIHCVLTSISTFIKFVTTSGVPDFDQCVRTVTSSIIGAKYSSRSVPLGNGPTFNNLFAI
jgi:hypothetical protein